MMSTRFSFGIALGIMAGTSACIVSKDSLGDGGSSDGSVSAGTGAGGGSHTGNVPGTGGTTTGDDATDGVVPLDVGPGSGGTPALDVATPTCKLVDAESCYPTTLAACVEATSWSTDADCVAAIESCYPFHASALAPATVIEACDAELEESCLATNAPGCSDVLCECTLGVYPYDWDNCWDLLLVGCEPGGASDCATVLAGCYPGATVEQYATCRQQVMDETPIEGGCNCPACGFAAQCEDELDACMGA